MDVSAISSSATRLLEAFEKMGLSQGEGFVSSGPSPVPHELARQFEDLLGSGEISPLSQSGAGAHAAPAHEISEISPVDAGSAEPAHAEPVSALGQAAQADGSPALLSPAQLYSLQFQVAMLRFTADSGSQIRQNASQGLDSLLRNQS